MKALDLFCCAGGAGRGLQNAGFHVTGWDIKPQKRYGGDVFCQGDVLALTPEYLREFDFVWASPPCQAHTTLKAMPTAKQHPNLIPQTRALLKAAGVPYCIENVMGSPLENPVMLCGTMFGLGVDDAELRRHRLFECSFPMLVPQCRHGERAVIGVYGGHVRNRKRVIGIYGHGPFDAAKWGKKRVGNGEYASMPNFTPEQGKAAMGIDWMTQAELSQAIPPAYSEFIARAWFDQEKA